MRSYTLTYLPSGSNSIFSTVDSQFSLIFWRIDKNIDKGKLGNITGKNPDQNIVL